MRENERPGSFIERETVAGSPIVAGGIRIIPLARSLRVRIPGLPAGLVWNRPASVVVQFEDGQEQILPVRDITRQIQFALLAGTLAGMISLWLIPRLLRKNRMQS